MTNPKEVLEKITNNIKDFWKIYEDTNSVKQLKQLQLLHFKEIVLATLTSQLEAIPEDYQENRVFFNDEQKAINEERQRQRQQLQDLINEWSELK